MENSTETSVFGSVYARFEQRTPDVLKQHILALTRERAERHKISIARCAVCCVFGLMYAVVKFNEFFVRCFCLNCMTILISH